VKFRAHYLDFDRYQIKKEENKHACQGLTYLNLKVIINLSNQYKKNFYCDFA
jgi:hypothetical protein